MLSTSGRLDVLDVFRAILRRQLRAFFLLLLLLLQRLKLLAVGTLIRLSGAPVSRQQRHLSIES